MHSVTDQNIAEQVTVELRSAIHSGELAPGERLVERKLAERLGVSHIPVREALTLLAQERLITREPRRGARVSELTATDLEEISSLRTILEQFMAIRVQERWNPDSEARLRAIIDDMSRAESGDISEVLHQDRLFHETLAELAEHRFLNEISSQLRGRIAGFLHAANTALEPGEQDKHVRSHLQILDAIASGDPERAKDVIASHVATAVARIQLAEPATRNSTSGD